MFGDAVYLRLADNPAEEAAAVIVAMRSLQALLALPPPFLDHWRLVRERNALIETHAASIWGQCRPAESAMTASIAEGWREIWHCLIAGVKIDVSSKLVQSAAFGLLPHRMRHGHESGWDAIMLAGSRAGGL